MALPPPINDSFALQFGGDTTRDYPFSLTDPQIKKIVELALAAPDFLKVAGDFWSQLLGGKKIEDFLKELLKGVNVSSCPTFQVTGSCKEYSSIKIEWFDPEVSQSSVPGVTIDAKPRALDPTDGKCKCTAKEAQPSGKYRYRVFIIKWWVTISIKGIVIPFLAQLNHITVSAPCCCGEEESPLTGSDDSHKLPKTGE